MKVNIVGAGIGGLSAAISLKEHNNSIKVVVHEKNKRIGYNPEGRRCGEAYTLWEELKKWKPVGKSIFNEIKDFIIIIDNKKYIYPMMPDAHFVLNRQEFICQLARKAKRLDVDIQTGDKVEYVEDLDGDYIVDASGCPSTIKKNLGLSMGIISIGYQQTLEKSTYFIKDTIKIFFTGGTRYFWIFPRDPNKKEINVGVGLLGERRHNLVEMLENFKEKNRIDGKINYTTGGLIPMGLQKPLKYKNILFVGDAGVGTFPLLAEGIYRALISGDVAGTCIAKGYPKNYPYIINRRFIKWDIAGKMILRGHNLLEKIGPEAVTTSLKFLLDINNTFTLIKLY